MKKSVRKKSGSAREKQLRYLSQSARLEEAVHPQMVRVTLFSICGCVLAFLLWSGFTNINEVARAPGEVVPQGFQQIVQHFDGGIVREIKVSDGQTVNAGDTLLVLDGAGSQEDLERAGIRTVTLEMQKERFKAFVDGRRPDFSSIKGATPGLVAEQMKIYDSMIDSTGKERIIIEEQIAQKKHSIQVLSAQQKTARQNVVIAQDMYDRKATLHSRGYLSDISHLQAKQEVNALRGENDRLAREVEQAQSSLHEYESRLKSLAAQKKNDVYQQLGALDAEIGQNAELMAKLQDRVGRLEVKAPVHGLVKGLAVNTIGAVVQPGQSLLEIVPLDKPLVVEVRIPPQSIGNMKPGQPVQVKISAFDFSRFGSVPGKLDSISPTTFTGDRGDRFYRGRVLLDRNHVGKNPKGNTVMPGMTVMADIIIGDKTILEYLVKPIHKSLLTAFSER